MWFFALALFMVTTAFAQPYPNRPVRIVVPYAAGGPTDIVARVVGQKLTEVTGQTVIVDNRPGAGGITGTDLAAKATPDGYTLLLCSSGPMVVSPALGEKFPYDVQKDIVPVTLVVVIPYLLLVNSATGPASVKELIAQAQKNPGKLNFGSAGVSTTSYFAGELFATMARVELTHVPYKGSSQAGTDLAGGQLQLMFEAVPAALPLVKGGRLKILGISTLERFALQPEIPTIAESGVPGYEISTWSAICAPGRTPEAIVSRLSGLLVKILQKAEVRERFDSLGAATIGNSVKEFAGFVQQERTKWNSLVKNSRAKSN